MIRGQGGEDIVFTISDSGDINHSHGIAEIDIESANPWTNEDWANEAEIEAPDARTSARAQRFAEARAHLEQASGGLIGPTELSKHTGKARQTLLNWANDHKILALPDNGTKRYPRFQFDKNWQVLGGLGQVLNELSAQGIVDWMALDVLLSPDPKFKLSPAQLLERGRIDDALQSATAHANQGAA